MRVRELHTWDERPDLIAEWQRLWWEQPGAPVFVHPTWARTWWRYFGSGRHMRVLLVEQNGRAVALAPLFLERPFPAPGRLRIIGAGVTNDFHDWLLPADGEVAVTCVNLLLDHLAHRWGWLALELQGLRPDSRLLPLLGQDRGRPFIVQPRPGPVNPVLPIHDTWEAYLTTRGGNVRRNLGKKRRRLERLGEVHYEHATAATALAAVDEAIHLHELRWSGRDDTTLVSRSARGRAFYRTVLPPLVDAGIADVVALRLDGRAIATQIGFLLGDTYFNYQAAFDPTQARYSPSTLLLAYLLEQAWSQGLSAFDFMTGDEPYKYEWAMENHPVTHLTVLPNQPIARLLGHAMDVGRHLRSLRAASHRASDLGASAHLDEPVPATVERPEPAA